MIKIENPSYEPLKQRAKKARLFESISSLLHWDQETYMPKKGIALRAEQLELIAGLHHQAKTDPEWARHLGSFIDIESGEIKVRGLTFEQERCLLRWRRDLLLQRALPTSFVEAFARLNAEAIAVWSEARKKNDFSLFAPYLEKTIEMARQKSRYLNPKADRLYDALLDLHEPEMTSAALEILFLPLKQKLKAILEKIMHAPQVDNQFLHGSFDKEGQLAFGNLLLQGVGYDQEAGRLDLSVHPFSTSLHPYDSRITTRIHKSGLFDSLSAVLHEVGHSLYEMALPVAEYGTPYCEALSLGIHESQSRFYETYVGQSRSFWSFFFPQLQKVYPQLGAVTLEQFYHAINRVAPSFIRVEADEVTYTFHVIIRFQLEKDLLEGKLSVKELPEAWNALMKEDLGIDVPSVQEGCLQDIHWSMGEFGYFPTYSLGNLYGAQFFETFTKEHPDWENRFEKGEFLFVKEWLGQKIHRHGRIYSSDELVRQVTGKPLSMDPYISYLTRKYDAIYR